jgi:negative regulator of flagellin synthesis FlgM
MSEINTRAPFFPNSRSAQKAYAEKTEGASPSAPIQRNDIERSKEISNTTKPHAKVDINDVTKDFSVIKKAVDNAPELDRSEKIAQLKAQINNGTYEVDYDGLADKLLQSGY